MKDAFEKLFRAVHQFKKLNTSAGCVAHTARTGGKRICRAER